MNRMEAALVRQWRRVGTRFMPFADVATTELPMARLLRLSLFQVTVGMATGLLVGTLNRVMIVELGVSATLVACMIAMPLLFAPFRALVGFRSDTHRSAFGWRRVPFLWLGTMLQFCGFGIMPFALILLAGDHTSPMWIGQAGGALAFLLVGAGMQITQTAGLALATDLAPPASRPRVVALMYVMLLVGMLTGSLVFGALLQGATPVRLIQVVQGAGFVSLVLNAIALWKQEARSGERAATASASGRVARPEFASAFARFTAFGKTRRFLLVVALGTAAFTMQDVILEPYGGEVLKLSVSATTLLTALMAFGALLGLLWTASRLQKGRDPYRLCAYGIVVGIIGFSSIIFSDPTGSPLLFRIGATLVGFGGGVFAVGTLIAAMNLDGAAEAGLTIGAWGSVQAVAAGLAIAAGGAMRDGVGYLASSGALGEALSASSTGYSAVYHIEIALLFLTLVVLGPLVRRSGISEYRPITHFGLAEFPK
jgi:BCD family chlorophyll transporter-like MFS transporter